jgi:hypothetical protein
MKLWHSQKVYGKDVKSMTPQVHLTSGMESEEEITLEI